ncbi:MAG: NAD(P)/FAD-dependent oxidoreductase [Phycisphaerales bacterium]
MQACSRSDSSLRVKRRRLAFHRLSRGDHDMGHAAIIGAGPAGLTAAIGLAKRGERVTIFESKPFPRQKVCGEFISPAAVPLLESILPPVELRRLGARSISRFEIVCNNRHARLEMPTNGWAISRARLDTQLLECAVDAGAVHRISTVRTVEFEADRVVLRMHDDAEVEADVVIHADGRGRLDPDGPLPLRRGVVGAKCHFAGPIERLEGVISMNVTPDAAIGFVCVEEGRVNCAMTVRSDVVRAFDGDFDRLLHDRIPECATLRRLSPWHTCGVPDSGCMPGGDARSFRIGNAAAAVDPVSGEGVGLALWSGATLADLWRPDNLAETKRAFVHAYRARLRLRRPTARLAGWCCMRPRLVAATWPLIRSRTVLMPWYRMTGKPGVATA